MSLFYYPLARPLNTNGKPLAAAKLRFYLASTTTLATVYEDADRETSRTNPVVADSAGVFPEIHLDPTVSYRVQLLTAADVLVDDIDPYVILPSQSDIGAALYPQTDAEETAGVTPVNYAYAPDIPVRDLRRDGVSKSGSASANFAGLQKAIDWASSRPGGIIRLPAGVVQFDDTLIIPTCTRLVGETYGLGVNQSTILAYTGSSIGIQIDGSYAGLEHLFLDNVGSGTVGVQMNGNFITLHEVSLTNRAGSAVWSTAAVQSNPDTIAFAHTLRRCFIGFHRIGWDVAQGNNMLADNSFFESNRTNVMVGRVGSVSGFTFANQCVAELFGDGRTDEILSGINIDIVACNGFAIRDSYFEANGTGAEDATNQRCVYLRSDALGGVIEGNYMYGGGQATGAITVADPAVDGVIIKGNHFNNFNGYAVVGATSGNPAQCEISSNACVGGTLGEYDNTFTPALAFGGGSTGITYSAQIGRWQRYGKFAIVKVTIQLTAKGSSTGTATITGLPAAIGHLSTSGTEDSGPLTVANLSTVSGGCTVQIKPGTPTTFNLYSAGAGGAQAALTDTNFGNTSYLNFSLVYQVAA